LASLISFSSGLVLDVCRCPHRNLTQSECLLHGGVCAVGLGVTLDIGYAAVIHVPGCLLESRPCLRHRSPFREHGLHQLIARNGPPPNVVGRAGANRSSKQRCSSPGGQGADVGLGGESLHRGLKAIGAREQQIGPWAPSASSNTAAVSLAALTEFFVFVLTEAAAPALESRSTNEPAMALVTLPDPTSRTRRRSSRSSRSVIQHFSPVQHELIAVVSLKLVFQARPVSAAAASVPWCNTREHGGRRVSMPSIFRFGGRIALDLDRRSRQPFGDRLVWMPVSAVGELLPLSARFSISPDPWAAYSVDPLAIDHKPISSLPSNTSFYSCPLTVEIFKPILPRHLLRVLSADVTVEHLTSFTLLAFSYFSGVSSLLAFSVTLHSYLLSSFFSSGLRAVVANGFQFGAQPAARSPMSSRKRIPTLQYARMKDDVGGGHRTIMGQGSARFGSSATPGLGVATGYRLFRSASGRVSTRTCRRHY